MFALFSKRRKWWGFVISQDALLAASLYSWGEVSQYCRVHFLHLIYYNKCPSCIHQRPGPGICDFRQPLLRTNLIFHFPNSDLKGTFSSQHFTFEYFQLVWRKIFKSWRKNILHFITRTHLLLSKYWWRKKLIQSNQKASSIHIMIELCYFSLDQWEIKIHLLWGKYFNIPHWPRSHSIAAHWRAFQIQDKSRHGLDKMTFSGDNWWRPYVAHCTH